LTLNLGEEDSSYCDRMDGGDVLHRRPAEIAKMAKYPEMTAV
jgi:hypothetical protein